MKNAFILSILILLMANINKINAQATVQFRISTVYSDIGDMDGWPAGDSDPQWDYQITDNTFARTSSDSTQLLNTNCPYTQSINEQFFDEIYNCSLPIDYTLVWSGRENDGVGSDAFSGNQTVNSITINPNQSTWADALTLQTATTGGTNCTSGGAVTWSIQLQYRVLFTSWPLGQANDLICNAINLGTLNSGSSVGNNNLSNYGNFCAGSSGEPNPWGTTNDQGVWFQFTTGTNPSYQIEFDANNDPQSIGDQIKIQLALYESSNNTCSGALTLIQESFQSTFWGEDMNVNCLKPNSTYFLLVDGEESITDGGQEGYFGLQINDNGIKQAADEICDAENLGLVPNGGSVGTPALSRSNICATNTNDPSPTNWNSNQTVWFKFQAPTSGHVFIDANSDTPFPIGTDEIDIQLAFYETNDGNCSGTLHHLSSQYTAGLFDEDLEIHCLTPGENYWVMLDGSSTNVSGIFDITISDGGQYPATNNNICNAKPLGTPSVGSPVLLLNEHNYCADSIAELTPSGWVNNQGVWYSFTAPTSGMVDIFLNDHGLISQDRIDLQIAVFDLAGDSCNGSPTELLSEHNDIGINSDEDVQLGCLTPGKKYWILVDGESTLIEPDLQEGIFDITVTAVDTVSLANTSIDPQTACNSLTWIDGNTYTSSNNTATHVLTNAAGCDSTVTLDLTINNSSNSTDVQTACNSYTWIDSNTYNASNNSATHTLTNAAGCDSTVTLDLTINNSSNSTDVQTACNSYTWIDGNTYNVSNNSATHTLTNAAGCDSTVTLDLTINNSSNSTDVQTACNSYTWIDGNTYNVSNNSATHTLTNAAGCDSTVTLDLTINNSSNSTDVQTACNSYTWIDGNTYNTSNNSVTHVLTNAVGCDSTVTLDLTVNTIDVTVTNTSPTLTANQPGASYQWLDCNNNNSIIIGENNISYTAIINGDYAVEITLNNCTDTSICENINTVGIIKNDFGDKFMVFPNPTDGNFSIDLGSLYKSVDISISNINGKLIYSKSFNQKQALNMSIKEPNGIYLITIIAGNKIANIRLIKN